MNFLISTAHAADSAGVPGAGEAFMMNLLLILVLVVLFYVLLIMPQQKRFNKHREMIDTLKKGTKVVTSGGLMGKVHKIVPDKNEIVIELAEGVRVTAVKSTIQEVVEKD